MVSDQYRMHRVRTGDEWVLATLARGNARFGDGDESDWQPPLGTDEASQFVADPNTVCIVAIDMATNHIAGFVYGGVLNRRHTKLRHLCLYEIGVDLDHRRTGVGQLLMEAFAAEARKLGIDRGFVIANQGDRVTSSIIEQYGAMKGDGRDVLYGLSF
ncbi:MAG: GNAT family N-acetyltransferase [Acidimicrobiales bacterium]|nr:GNAT family N-acetyltransferase [Acidimicrobiales bacterium]